MLTSRNLFRGRRYKVKRPDLLILIAIWNLITAFILAIGIISIPVFAFPEAVKEAKRLLKR